MTNDATTDFIVTARDVKAAGFCLVPGAKDFLEARGLSLKDFVRDGLPASIMLEFRDPRADRAVTKAQERLNRG